MKLDDENLHTNVFPFFCETLRLTVVLTHLLYVGDWSLLWTCGILSLSRLQWSSTGFVSILSLSLPLFLYNIRRYMMRCFYLSVSVGYNYMLSVSFSDAAALERYAKVWSNGLAFPWPLNLLVIFFEWVVFLDLSWHMMMTACAFVWVVSSPYEGCPARHPPR